MLRGRKESRPESGGPPGSRRRGVFTAGWLHGRRGTFHADEVLGRIVHAVARVPARRVLDLACGPGIVAAALAPTAGRVIGVDATPRMIELAAARCAAGGHAHCAFQVASAERLPFADGAFDVAVSRLAFHHFQAPAAVLAEVRRALRPDGRLVVADIVSSPVAEEAAVHNALERLRDPTHVGMMPPAQLAAAVTAGGFELLHQESWQQPRGFSEWMAVIDEPDRTKSLDVILRALARAGHGAGIQLEDADGELRFRHT